MSPKIVAIEQGVQGDAVPLPEREVSSHNPLLFPGPPQAARERYLNSYEEFEKAVAEEVASEGY
jgi:hypothetical protein